MSELHIIHLWTVTAALLCALSCALLGTFLVLRRMSLVGDAISHSILPGLAGAFLVTGSRSVFPMFVGAAACGLLTVAVSQFLAKFCKVDHGAALGVVFTTLFAIGVLLIRLAADQIDLDPSCVLYGLLEYIALTTVDIGGFAIPRAVVVLAGMLLVNIVLVTTLYKELKLSSFDPAMSTALGFNAQLIQAVLMTAVAATSVASFEAVGSILVVAMFIVPAATARLLTDSFRMTLLISLLVATASAIGGYGAAVAVDTSVAGMMSVAAGVLFLCAAIFAPRYGVFARLLRRVSERIRICSEDMLGLAYRCEEGGYKRAFPLTRPHLIAASGGGLTPHLALRGLVRGELLRHAEPHIYELTPAGADAARRIVRSHRLWEAYLVQQLNLAPDHVHGSATKLEHHTSPGMVERLVEKAGSSPVDPHGRKIP